MDEENTTATLNQPEIEEESTGFDAAGDLGEEQPDAGTDADAGADETAEDFDVTGAVREIQSRFDGLDANVIRAALGRVSSLQSTLDRLQGQVGNSTAAEQRIAQLEEDISTLMDVLASGESLLEEEQRTRISGRRQARSKAAQDEELINKIIERVQPQSQNSTLPPEWQRAQDRTVAYAEAKGLSQVDMARLPWAAAQAAGDPEAAYQYLKRAVDGFQAEDGDDGAAQRVAGRKGAAGKGAPPRKAANRSIEELIDVYGQGGSLSDAEKKTLAEALGHQT